MKKDATKGSTSVEESEAKLAPGGADKKQAKMSAEDEAVVAPELRPAAGLGNGSDQKVGDSPILESGRAIVFEETRLGADGDAAGKMADAFKGDAFKVEIEGIKATVVEDRNVSAFREYATRKAANPADELAPDLAGGPGKSAYDGKDAAAPAAEAFSARGAETSDLTERQFFDEADPLYGKAVAEDGPETLGFQFGIGRGAVEKADESEPDDGIE